MLLHLVIKSNFDNINHNKLFENSNFILTLKALNEKYLGSLFELVYIYN